MVVLEDVKLCMVVGEEAVVIPVSLAEVPSFTGLLGTGATSFAAMMGEGRCQD